MSAWFPNITTLVTFPPLDLLSLIPSTPNPKINAIWTLSGVVCGNLVGFLAICAALPDIVRAGSVKGALLHTFNGVGCAYIFSKCAFMAVRSPLWTAGFFWSVITLGTNGPITFSFLKDRN